MPWILRNPPEPLWTRFRERATADGWSLKGLILQLAADYVAGRIQPSGPPPPRESGQPTE